MADKTGIEWTRGDDGTAGATWNPILGCSKVSPGCESCYAIRNARIRESNPNPKVAIAYAGLVEKTADGSIDWTGQVNVIPDRLLQPIRWKRGRRIFVNAQSDLFHDSVPDEVVVSIFAVMALAPQHTFQVLTKRHGRMRSLLSDDGFVEDVTHEILAIASEHDLPYDHLARALPDWWPLSNVWLGVSVEDQKWARVRIPVLLETPAAVRWLSLEPLLGPVTLCLCPDGGIADGCWIHGAVRIDWSVVGGESGPGARPLHPRWVRTLGYQCTSARVPFFYKQAGEYAPVLDGPRLGDTVVYPDGTHRPWAGGSTDGYMGRFGDGFHIGAGTAIVRKVGKKAAGRLLDGREWSEFPETKEPTLL